MARFKVLGGVVALLATLPMPPRARGAPQVPPATELLILQTSIDPLALSLSPRGRANPDARIMASGDCAELRPGLYVIAVKLAAGAARANGKRTVGDLRKCTVKPGSLTALGMAAVDPSFVELREAPVNFFGFDMVTHVRAGLLLRPWYQASAEDQREGYRVAVEDLTRGRRVIKRDCVRPEVARSATHIAIACAVAQAAEQPLYRTTVYRPDNLTELRVVDRCRRPQLTGTVLRCAKQTVGSNGRISETVQTLALEG